MIAGHLSYETQTTSNVSPSLSPSHPTSLPLAIQLNVHIVRVCLASCTDSERALGMNPFLTNSKKSDDRHVHRIRQKHGRRSYLSVGIGGDSQSFLELEPIRSKDRGLLSYNIDDDPTGLVILPGGNQWHSMKLQSDKQAIYYRLIAFNHFSHATKSTPFKQAIELAVECYILVFQMSRQRYY